MADLPNAHVALSSRAAALLTALEETEQQTETDPQHLRLHDLLRSLAHCGEDARQFLSRHGARVIRAVAAVFQLASGRFGEPEQRIGAAAELAIRSAPSWWPAESWRALSAWQGCTGALGVEVHVLAWWMGASWQLPVGLTRDAHDAASLANHPDARALLVPLLHDPERPVRATAAAALAGHPEALELLAPLLQDLADDVRAAAAAALASHPDARALLAPFLHDPHAPAAPLRRPAAPPLRSASPAALEPAGRERRPPGCVGGGTSRGPVHLPADTWVPSPVRIP